MTAVADVMTRGVRTMAPSDTVVLAAQAMDELNVGVIPVCEGEKLVGMVTDRDIVVRGVAQQRDPRSTKLADVMSSSVRTAHEEDDVDEVLSEMSRSQIRRLPVVDQQERLVGIISLGDIAAKDAEDDGDVAMSLGDISSPAEPDRSNQSQASGPAGGGSASGQPHRQPS
ncbi:MAG: CBS domain-containing protein [Gemmatimonadetes bacterium]|nr:CBS domain-containing protein [Gemmatimonadota bacterium]